MRTVLLLALLQWPLGAEPPTPAAAPTPETESRDAGPAAIALPEVLRSVEKAHRALKSMAEGLADDQLIEEVQKGLPALVSSVDSLTGAGPPSPKQDLADVRPALQRADGDLSKWDEGLESAVRSVYERRQELQGLDEVWSLTEAQARQDGAPPPVLERIAALRASIAASAAKARTQLGQLLTAQSQVATVRLRIADALGSVAKAEALQAEQLFEVESLPFSKLLSRPMQVGKVRQQIRQALRTHSRALQGYVRSQSEYVLPLLGLLVVLTIALWRGRTRLGAEMERDPSISTVVDVLRHPFATASLLVLTVAMVWLQQRPVVVSQVFLLGMLAAFFVAGRSLIPARARWSTYLLGVIVAIYVASTLAPELSLLRRALMLFVSFVGTVLAAGELRRRGWEADIASKWRRKLFRAALIAATISSPRLPGGQPRRQRGARAAAGWQHAVQQRADAPALRGPPGARGSPGHRAPEPHGERTADDRQQRRALPDAWNALPPLGHRPALALRHRPPLPHRCADCRGGARGRLVARADGLARPVARRRAGLRRYSLGRGAARSAGGLRPRRGPEDPGPGPWSAHRHLADCQLRRRRRGHGPRRPRLGDGADPAHGPHRYPRGGDRLRSAGRGEQLRLRTDPAL